MEINICKLQTMLFETCNNEKIIIIRIKVTNNKGLEFASNKLIFKRENQEIIKDEKVDTFKSAVSELSVFL